MPRLIVLNGPPACGKSTLARMYVDDHPLSLNLDIDVLRDLIGRWREDPPSAGLLARDIALAAARCHLTAGHDVVIPQFLARPTFLEQVQRLAGEVGADFHEIVLLDTKENALRRFAERSAGQVDVEYLSGAYDRLMSIIASRTSVVVVPTVDGQPERAYRAFLDSLVAFKDNRRTFRRLLGRLGRAGCRRRNARHRKIY